MKIMYLDGFQCVATNNEEHPLAFTEADQIIQTISNSEVSIQARPEENAKSSIYNSYK